MYEIVNILYTILLVRTIECYHLIVLNEPLPQYKL